MGEADTMQHGALRAISVGSDNMNLEILNAARNSMQREAACREARLQAGINAHLCGAGRLLPGDVVYIEPLVSGGWIEWRWPCS